MKNPFDDQWLKNWHKILSEGESEHEKQIRETKKSLDDAKLVRLRQNTLILLSPAATFLLFSISVLYPKLTTMTNNSNLFLLHTPQT